MLSYRHGFHAGNFADVTKHALLVQLVLAMQRKQKGFLVLDTHAGAGGFDLRDELPRKLGEFELGIARLWGRTDLPEALRPYLDAVEAANTGGKRRELRFYPGSPALVQGLLRPQDRLVCCELHPSDQALLQLHLGRRRGVRVERMDGLNQGIKTFLPPPEARGLVFIDPAYEQEREYRAVRDALLLAARRFAGGVLVLWYPLLASRASQGLADLVVNAGLRDILRFELSVRDGGQGMFGCGMLVVNPPWQIEERMRPAWEWLAERLDQGGGKWRIDRIAPE